MKTSTTISAKVPHDVHYVDVSISSCNKVEDKLYITTPEGYSYLVNINDLKKAIENVENINELK